ncbi:cAMP-binding domain of CRP or a regulatory subunit of cAMP-dependent protein kinases [Myroides marinus]|uniref:cAMP-binding domain of CRP or a regulatory subunit of cAMP-dependent protein kinases n=1 Tax=Myroides marinus TaxID=703342 RepID=A0A1H6WAD4_9FLAO|nr:Crp/Fnr family transcriptional regulator [Myroides marinus]SEJ13991.1 cAMP-binding domain of CRP or a regulatory subunit of cAMP-dependent protein kinases [Myroides marinus]
MNDIGRVDIFESCLVSIGGLKGDEINLSSHFFEPVLLKKGDFFIRENEVCRYIGFVAIGAVKAYGSDKEERENITCFKFENEFVTSFSEFISQENSTRNIKAIEDCVIYRISYSDYLYLLDKVPAWNKIIQSVLEQEYNQKQKYMLNYNNKTALEKYSYMLFNEPMLIKRVTTQDLASYLGITQRSLTRAKGQIHKNTL